MRYIENNKEETGYQKRYREDRKVFWFGDTGVYRYWTQQEYDEYWKKAREKLYKWLEEKKSVAIRISKR